MTRLTPSKSGKRGRRGSRGDGRGFDSRLARDVKILDMPQYTIRGIGDLYEFIAVYSEDWWDDHGNQNRCVAHRKNGEQCLKAAIRGANVCRFHGGAAGHVRRKARERIELAANRIAKELWDRHRWSVRSGEAESRSSRSSGEVAPQHRTALDG